MRYSFFIVCLFLCGCTGSASHLTSMSAEELRASEYATADKLVEALWYQRALNARAELDSEICEELIHRGALSQAEINRARSKQFEVGDSIVVPYIGWGKFMRHNVYDSGKQHQYIINVVATQFLFYTGADRRIDSYQAMDR